MSRPDGPASDPAASTFGGVVAIDGPSGTGKSTVARRLALRLGTRYLDTGAMYRAATLAVLDAQIDPTADEEVIKVVSGAEITVTTDPAGIDVVLDGRRVNREIRSALVTENVSAVSAVPAVRKQMVAAQRQIIGAGGIVVEGRDTGAVVWPQAHPKIYLTAHPGVRAERRANQLGGSSDLGVVADSLHRRDRLDSSRQASPLTQAPDALVLDTTELGVDEVVEVILGMVKTTPVPDGG